MRVRPTSRVPRCAAGAGTETILISLNLLMALAGHEARYDPTSEGRRVPDGCHYDHVSYTEVDAFILIGLLCEPSSGDVLRQ
jgi:hypothetical protein